jgi:hypothetical protein
LYPVEFSENWPPHAKLRSLEAPRLTRIARWWVAGSGRNLSAEPVRGDNDPRVIWAIALVANFIGFLVGAATGRLLTRRADPG